jgi:hypothetical protein
MTTEHHVEDARISNWTLATGTLPGHREVHAPVALKTLPRPAKDATHE